MIKNILYVFGGEKASGAEIVTERLIANNKVASHLFIAPGKFSQLLTATPKNYQINVINRLRRLRRNNASPMVFYFKAFCNYVYIPILTYRYIKRHKIDAVHCNTIGQAAYLLPLVILSRLFRSKVKWIWTDHDLKYYFQLDNIFSKLCERFYHITFAVSEAVKCKYDLSKNVVVLYNGLDTNIFKPDTNLRSKYRQNLRLSEDAIIIGIAGVISKRKGQLDLIKAFNRLKNEYQNLYLVLAGRFDDIETDYNRLVQDQLNAPGIFYVGELVDMVSYYNGCDIVVSNSDVVGSEPLGSTIYEAMACQKVIVASCTGGTPEIVDDKINGYLFEADNETALIAKLKEVITNFDKKNDIKYAARQKVIERFDIQYMLARYIKLLNDLN